jgi:hypothetical protein
LPVDVDFAQIPVNDSFLTEDSTDGDAESPEKETNGSREPVSPSKSVPEGMERPESLPETKEEAAGPALSRKSFPDAPDVLDPVEPKLPGDAPAERTTSEGNDDIESTEKSAILARISRSARDIENRSARPETESTPDSEEQPPVPTEGKEGSSDNPTLLPPPGVTEKTGVEEPSVEAETPPPSQVPPKKERILISENDTRDDALVTAAMEDATPVAKGEKPKPNRSAGEKEHADPMIEKRVRSRDGDAWFPGESLASPPLVSDEASALEALFPPLWQARVRALVPYGKIFLICFLLPMLILALILIMAKDGVRSFFVGGEEKEADPLPALLAENKAQKEALAALDLKMAEMTTAMIAMGERVSVEPPEVHEEIEYLKMRNQLTAYADEAITMSNRESYEKLWNVVYDETQKDFHAAAVAEILRIKFFYASGSRLGAWTLPVRELFPGVETESGLEVHQVIELMLDRTQDWRVRVRAARLLQGYRTRRVLESLREAIHDDPNLDVLKEAVRSFEVNAGFVCADFFDVKSIDAWWEANSEALDGEGGAATGEGAGTPSGDAAP